MPASGYISDAPEVYVNPTTGVRAPAKWYGSTAIDGTISPWKDVPSGSEYTYLASATVFPALFMKIGAGETSADWARISYERLVSGRPAGLLLILTRK